MSNLKIRQILIEEYPLLEEFQYHAIFLPVGVGPLPREIIFKPEIFVYIKDFGGKDDCCVVVELDKQIVGAAWTRIIPAYGHIDDKTPELAISVLPNWRRQGIGSKMMNSLFDLLRERGYLQTSLAVQKENPAVRFYLRLGYNIIEEKTEEYLMIKYL
jgi:ribosomal protein S18 acetylase RimI-like enzyme